MLRKLDDWKTNQYFCPFLKIFSLKVQLFWESHKNLRHRPYGFDIYLVNIKAIRTMAQIFVAFWEKLNFNLIPLDVELPKQNPALLKERQIS